MQQQADCIILQSDIQPQCEQTSHLCCSPGVWSASSDGKWQRSWYQSRHLHQHLWEERWLRSPATGKIHQPRFTVPAWTGAFSSHAGLLLQEWTGVFVLVCVWVWFVLFTWLNLMATSKKACDCRGLNWVAYFPLLYIVYYLRGSQDSLLVRVPDSWSKGWEFKSWQEQWENFLLQS